MRQSNCEKTGMLSCLEVEFLSLPRVALLFLKFALLHSVPHVQLSLVTILRNCGCIAVAILLGVPLPLHAFVSSMPTTHSIHHRLLDLTIIAWLSEKQKV
jgi:hypothetical protein